jgi:hypothetical protein
MDITDNTLCKEKQFVLISLLIAVCLNIYFISVGFFNPLLDHYAFRQTQTAISVYYYLKEGLTLNYITPVLGTPWSIPFEFPTYQFIVALLCRITTIPLEAAGRLISIVFFYLSLYYIYKALQLFYDKIFSLIPIILILLCPQYIYWSRTFMMESAALFFSIAHCYYLVKLKQRIVAGNMLLCMLTGVLGSLTKITTYIVVMVPIGVYLSGILISDFRSRSINIKYWVSLFFPVFLSIVLAMAWTRYADHVKELNPLAREFITSRNLTEWNFGTLRQRLNLANWNRIISWSIQYGIGSFAVFMLIPLWGALCSKKDWLLIALLLLGYVSGPLIFFNLYFIHYYYHYSNIFFIVIAIGVVIIAVADKQDVPSILRKCAIWCVMPSICVTMLYSYYTSDYYKAQINNGSLSPLVSCLRNNLKESDVFMIYDNDWSSVLPYYLERKAIMNRDNLPLDNPRMASSINLTGKDKIVAIIKNEFNQAFAEEVQRCFGMHFLMISPGVYIRSDRYADISRACSGASDVK